MHNIVILAHSAASGKHIEALLRREGVGRIRVVTDAAKAVCAVAGIKADCLFFDRDLLPGFHTLFGRFRAPLTFVAMRGAVDKLDAIDCLNSRRFAAYLLYPIGPEDVRQALHNLAWLKRERGLSRCTSVP